MPGRSPLLILLAVVLAITVACSSEAGTGAGDGTTVPTSVTEGSAVPGTTPGGGGSTDPSVPVVDPASVEAFCALDAQLDQLTAAQIEASVDDPEAFRADVAAFIADNDAVIDQYVAAAPPEIRDDVTASVAQTQASVDDAALFGQLLSGAGDRRASDRVSAFIGVNCPA